MATHYHLYLDDSGTKEWAAEGRPYGTNNTRSFVFGGPLLLAGVARELAETISQPKALYIRQCQPSRSSQTGCANRASGSEDTCAFTRSAKKRSRCLFDSYYDFAFRGADLVLIACVVDKVHMRDVYGERAWYPPALAYEAVVQRVQQDMNGRHIPDAQVRVIVDDMSGATPRGNQYRLESPKPSQTA